MDRSGRRRPVRSRAAIVTTSNLEPSALRAGVASTRGGASPGDTPARRDGSAVVATLVAVAREHASLFVLLFTYVAVAFGIDAAFPERDIVRLRVYDEVFFIMLEAYAIAFIVGFSLYEIRNLPPGRSVVAWISRSLQRRYLTVERVGAFVLMVVYARLLTDTFASLKAAARRSSGNSIR